ncbi:hypothetical protein [Oceanobacillus kimchii]|nr:hypothetical protein [Oceanobacillus kimchii]
MDDTSIVSMGDDGMYGVQHLQLIAPMRVVKTLNEKYEGVAEEELQ